MRTALLGLMLIGLGACHAAEVRPDDMSADAHRQAAQRDRALANDHQARFDAASRTQDGFDVPARPEREIFRPYPHPDVDRSEFVAAQSLRAHAEAHEKAAAELERFESAECAGIPAQERAACPLVGPVAEVREIPDGLRITLAHADATSTVLARMRCHLAFARSRDVPSCPLYVRGVSIERGPDPGTIELRGATAAAVEELRRRAPEELSISRPIPTN